MITHLLLKPCADELPFFEVSAESLAVVNASMACLLCWMPTLAFIGIADWWISYVVILLLEVHAKSI